MSKHLVQEDAKVMISSKESNVKKAVEKLQSKGLQVAGTVMWERQKIEKTSLRKLRNKIFDINVKSTFLLMKKSLPFLKSLLGIYSVSKTALLGLTKATAEDLAFDGIRVNCIAPGIIKTKLAVTFLASSDASYITGETIVVSGDMQSRF
ncbi:hypothetical protein ACFW04_012587 [Cataglyphis niger]